MLRTTLYGTLTQDEELNKNEKAMLYIKECAELVGLEVIEGETAFSMTFMAEIMKRLRETIDSEHQWIPVSERLPEERTAVLVYVPEWENVYCACYEPKNEQWGIFGTYTKLDFEVVAWMPLPKPYKEVSKA